MEEQKSEKEVAKKELKCNFAKSRNKKREFNKMKELYYYFISRKMRNEKHCQDCKARKCFICIKCRTWFVAIYPEWTPPAKKESAYSTSFLKLSNCLCNLVAVPKINGKFGGSLRW